MKKTSFKKSINRIALVSVIIAGLVSCNTEDVQFAGPSISVSPQTLEFDREGKPVDGNSFTISSNRDWKATLASNADWLRLSQENGTGDAPVELTLLPNDGEARSVMIKVASSISYEYVTVKQAGIAAGETLYFEDTGSSVEQVDGFWPYVDAFTGWSRQGTVDQADVTYTGTNASVRNSGSNYEPEGNLTSGAPYVFLGVNPAFTIGEINVTGKTSLTFRFAISYQSGYSGGPQFDKPITSSTIKLEGSIDGSDWTQLTFTNSGTPAKWVIVTSEFKVPAGTEKILLRFSEPEEASAMRFDDFTLRDGGNGTITIGDDDPDPGDKTYVTMTELRAYGAVTITDNVYVKGIIVNATNTTSSVKNFVVADQTGGITIRFAANVDPATYPQGTGIEIALENVTIALYEDLMQLSNLPAANVSVLSSGNALPYTDITAAELLTGSYESMYVGVKDVQIVSSYLGNNMGSNDHTSTEIESLNSDIFIMFVSQYSDFVNERVPQGSGTLKGVASINKGVVQIMPQATTDFSGMTGPRFNTPATLAFGTPVLSPSLKVGQAIADGKISIPYQNADGTESYNVTVDVSGAGAAGISVSPAAVTLTASTGIVEIPVTGTPTSEGEAIFTINGINELTANVLTVAVVPEGSGGSYEAGTLASWDFTQMGLSTTQWATEPPLFSNGSTDILGTEAYITTVGFAQNGNVSYTASNRSIYGQGFDPEKAFDATHWLFKLPLEKVIPAGWKIGISYKAWGTGTSPANFNWEISIDNINWTIVDTYTLTTSANTEITVNPYSIISDISSSNIYIRLRPNDTASIGGAVFAASGNTRLSDITISLSE